MERTGAGYKRATKEFGLPLDTVKSWGREARGVGSRPRARARRDELGLPEPEPPPPPDLTEELEAELGEWDPTKCTREEWLVQAIRRCLARADIAMAATPPHGGVARQWEVTAGGYRDELDRLRRDREAEEKAAGRDTAAMAPPAELARRVLRLARVLVQVAPAEARELRDQLTAELER